MAQHLIPMLPLWLQRPDVEAPDFLAGFDRQDGMPALAASISMVREGGIWFLRDAAGNPCERPSAKEVLPVMQLAACESLSCQLAYTGVVRIASDVCRAGRAGQDAQGDRLLVLLGYPPGVALNPTNVACQAQAAAALARWLEELLNGLHRQDQLLPALYKAAHGKQVSPTMACKPTLDTSLRLALASCQYPGGVFDSTPRQPLSDLAMWAGPADRAAMSLRQHCLDEQRPIDLVILTGDQVYVDATAGVFNAPSLRPQDPWNHAYRQRSRNLAWHALCGAMVGRGLVMLDDHEIEDNWYQSQDTGAVDFDKGREGVARFREEQTFTWPTVAPSGHLWCDVSEATPWPVFLADTRSERQPRTLHNLQQVHIMQRQQRAALEDWIERAARAGTPHFLVSSSAVLPRLRSTAREPAMALYEDNWAGYPASLHWLLQTLWTHRASNVVLLAGDEHVSSTCRIRLQGAGKPAMTVHAIHSSALYAPYPFANTQPKDLAQPDDRFVLPMAGGDVQVDTHTAFHPGDGFAVLDVCKQDQQWVLNISFVKASSGHSKVVSVCLGGVGTGAGI